jgi:hypothetical protein
MAELRHPEGSGEEAPDKDNSGSEDVVMAVGANLQVEPGAVVPDFEGARPVARWGSVMTFRYPDGVQRHPRVLNRVEKELGRICAIDTGDDGVRLSFSLKGRRRDEARADCESVAAHLLGVLGLSDESLVEALVIDRSIDGAPYPPLSAVRGPD